MIIYAFSHLTTSQTFDWRPFFVFYLRCVSRLTSVQTWRTSWGTCYRWTQTCRLFEWHSFVRFALCLLECTDEMNVLVSSPGGSHKTLREPQERRQWHQGPQVVCYNWLDRHLPEKGMCVYDVCIVNRCAAILLLCLPLISRFSPCTGGSSLCPQVQRTGRHQQLRRLRGGGDPRLLHWEMCQGVCWVLELESDRGRKKDVGRVKGRLVKWET